MLSQHTGRSAEVRRMTSWLCWRGLWSVSISCPLASPASIGTGWRAPHPLPRGPSLPCSLPLPSRGAVSAVGRARSPESGTAEPHLPVLRTSGFSSLSFGFSATSQGCWACLSLRGFVRVRGSNTQSGLSTVPGAFLTFQNGSCCYYHMVNTNVAVTLIT